MSITSNRTLCLAGLLAATTSLATTSVTLWNVATAQGHVTHNVAMSTLLDPLSPQSRHQLALCLGIFSLHAVALLLLGCYQRGKAFTKSIQRGERGPLSFYLLGLPLAGATCVTNMALVSNAYLLGFECGLQAALGWALGVIAIVGFATMILPLLAASLWGRQHPMVWRFAAMLSVCGAPAWFVGANAVTLTIRSILMH